MILRSSEGLPPVAGSRQAAEGGPLLQGSDFQRPQLGLVWVLYPLSGLITVVKGLGHGSIGTEAYDMQQIFANKYLKTNGETEKGLLGCADKNSSRQFNNYRGCYDYD